MITRDFRVGDKVTCNIYDKGVVTEVAIEKVLFVVKVTFDTGLSYWYTKDGKLCQAVKRSLFIIPKKKPTLAEVRAKYKELQSNIKEVGYVEGKDNYYIYGSYDDCGEYDFEANYHNGAERFNMKYISKEDANIIVGKMEEFVKIN